MQMPTIKIQINAQKKLCGNGTAEQHFGMMTPKTKNSRNLTVLMVRTKRPQTRFNVFPHDYLAS
jgi:hypothetical protein